MDREVLVALQSIALQLRIICGVLVLLALVLDDVVDRDTRHGG